MPFAIKKAELVPAANPGTVHVSQIPKEVVELLEDAWKQIKADPMLEGHVMVENGTRGEQDFMAYAKSWGQARRVSAAGNAVESPDDAERVTVSKVSRKGVPDGELYFALKPYDPNAAKPGRKPKGTDAAATDTAKK